VTAPAIRVTSADDPAIIWGAGQQGLGAYVRALSTQADIVKNTTFSTHVLQLEDRAFCVIAPTTSSCWLTSLATTYGKSARDEVVREVSGVQGAGFNAISHLTEGLLRVARADQAVYPNHLLFSTSLYGDWNGKDLPQVLSALRGAFPDRAIIWRSLTNEDNATLVARMSALGGRKLLSRIVWRIADTETDWAPRRDARDDRRLAGSQGLHIVSASSPSEADLARVAQLYADLYRNKYSRTNPDYSEAFLRAAIESGVLTLRLIRNEANVIEAFAGEHAYQGTLVNPMLGYDRTLPQSRGLYRIAMAASAERALAEGLVINYSAGAAAFKRNRGARPALEFSMVFDDHLPPWRRSAYRALAAGLDAMAPMLERIALK
jgi:hypothetical protein